MSIDWGSGLHSPDKGEVNARAYEQYVGRWSRPFVPALLAAANIGIGNRVLDVAAGTGEASNLALSTVGPAGLVIGADISSSMLRSAATRLSASTFAPVTTDGQALAFQDGSFDAVVCQLGLMFFPNPGRGLSEFRRVLRKGRRVAVCVISPPARAPMWGILADSVSRYLPGRTDALYLAFSLGDPVKLTDLMVAAGFIDVRLTRETYVGVVNSFAEYWAPIETGTGLIPHAYLSLSEIDRLAVRREVQSTLSQFETNGQLVLPLDMLIASGRA